MSEYDGLYSIRNSTEKDHNFILATFLRGLYYGDSWFSKIPKDIFMNNYKHVIQALLLSPKTKIRVACLPDDSDVILGYAMTSQDDRTIHWVYVKSIWRDKGIAKALVPTAPAYASHLSALGSTLLTKLPNTVFNPFSIGE